MTGAGTDSSRTAIEGGPAVILVRPQLAVNIGMCARAMANFGLTDLRLVNPREGWPRTGALRKGAFAAAAGAVHLLENATLFDTLEDAVADMNFVWATTARARGDDKRVCPPAAAMSESARAIATGDKHAIMYGPERTGLENDEIALADALITFPVNPAYASLNLAQAVLLTGYEWFRASQGDVIPFKTEERSPPATREMLISFFQFFEDNLAANGFFRPGGKREIMQRNLRNMLHRMALTDQDVRTLRGALVRLIDGPRAKGRKAKLAEEQREKAAQMKASEAAGER